VGLTSNQENKIIELLSQKIESKLKNYAQESAYMPFLVKLIQDKKKVASYSFIQSLVTTLGMSIYENVSKIIVEDCVAECATGHNVDGLISKEQKSTIDNIVSELRNKTRTCNIKKEIEEVLKADAKDGKERKDSKKADFYMMHNGREYYFEIKTAKPNIDVFTKTKTKLLEWVARRKKIINVYMAIPYNPYHPDVVPFCWTVWRLI